MLTITPAVAGTTVCVALRPDQIVLGIDGDVIERHAVDCSIAVIDHMGLTGRQTARIDDSHHHEGGVVLVGGLEAQTLVVVVGIRITQLRIAYAGLVGHIDVYRIDPQDTGQTLFHHRLIDILVIGVEVMAVVLEGKQRHTGGRTILPATIEAALIGAAGKDTVV